MMFEKEKKVYVRAKKIFVHCDCITYTNTYTSLCCFLPVDVLLKATGNAPIMKTKKWTVDKDKKIGWIIEFIKKYLKLEKSESLVSKF